MTRRLVLEGGQGLLELGLRGEDADAGARVVGAGFGGCMVAVTTAERASELRAVLGPRAWVYRAGGPADRVEVP